MKFYVKLVLLTLVCMAHCVALDIIVREDSARHSKFIKNKRDAAISGHTQTGHTVLAEERRVGGTATDAQRKQVFQFIAGTRIIDGGIEVNGQQVIANFRHTVVNQALANHFIIIELVDQISQAFVHKIKIDGHGCNLYDDRLARLTQLSGVRSDLFIDWFNESLEKHYVEFMFFGGADVGTPFVGGRIDRKWFKTVQAQFSVSATSIQTCKNGEVQQTWILKNDIPFVIYKPSYISSKKSRNIYAECLSGLCAKAMNIDDVVNRVIPVRVEDSRMTFDLKNPTGTLEPFLGFSESLISGEDDFSKLLTHVCEFNKKTKIGKHDTTIAYRSLSATATYHTLTQAALQLMFLSEGEYRSRDVRALADSKTIKAVDLFKIIMFWYLSDYFDMHVGNILFVPDLRRKTLKPVVIDCEKTFGNTAWSRQNPAIYQLDQAKTAIRSAVMQQLLNVSRDKLSAMFAIFGDPYNNRQKNLFFTRLDELKRYCQEERTIGKLMNLILKPTPEDQLITTYSGTKNKFEYSESKKYKDKNKRVDRSRLYQRPYYSLKQNFIEIEWIFSTFSDADFTQKIRVDSVENTQNIQQMKTVRELLDSEYFI